MNQRDTLKAKYVSEWEEGIVQTDCTIHLSEFTLTVNSVDCSYEHLESEYIEVELEGKTVQFDVEDGRLTDQGLKDIISLFGSTAQKAQQFVKSLTVTFPYAAFEEAAVKFGPELKNLDIGSLCIDFKDNSLIVFKGEYMDWYTQTQPRRA